MGCDRDEVAPVAVKKVPVWGVDVQSVTPLPANRVTHVTPGKSGAVFWVQESEAGHETVFVMSEGSVPVSTTLTSGAIAQAFGVNSVTGNVQSLVAASDGKIYFYFTGGKGKRLLCGLGCYTPENGRTRIVADTAELMSQSEMGDSISLARGTLLLAGDQLWVWLRHDDGYAVLSAGVRGGDVKLRRAFVTVRGNGEEIRMTSAGADLAIGAENSLIYMDRRTRKIWKIGELGEAAEAGDVSDLPAGLTAPSVDEKGRMVFFAPEEIPLNEFEIMAATRPSKFPGLVILDGSVQTVLGRAVFTAPAKFNVRAMAVGQLVRDRTGWLAYERQTGELLRLRVVER